MMRSGGSSTRPLPSGRSEEHTSELQSRRDLHSFPTRRSSDLLLVQQLNTNLVHKAITLSVTDDAKRWILDKTSAERSYGARPLRRALQRFIEDPLSEALIAGGIAQRPAFLE